MPRFHPCVRWLMLLVAFGLGLAGEENPWRAGADSLTERIERLAVAGEVDAARAVLTVLLGRDKIAESGLDDRCRMSVAKALAKVGRTAEALALVKDVTWADKAAAKAAAIVALELEIRHRAILDDFLVLRSGAIPARDAYDSELGQAGGTWAERRTQAVAFFDLLDRGARMVRAEGGQIVLPAPQPLLTLAAYAHQPWSPARLAKELGDPTAWKPELALAACRLHLEEHDAPLALAAAETLFAKFADTPPAQEAFSLLRTWQLRRQVLAKTVSLWHEPAVDSRLEALAARFAQANLAVRAAVDGERDLAQAATGQAVSALIEAASAEPEKPADRIATICTVPTASVSPPQWRLALDHDGLSLAPDRQRVSAGTACRLSVTSQFRGPHRLRLHRLADAKTWDALRKGLDNRLLPAALKEQDVELGKWPALGSPDTAVWEVAALEPGFYVATATARGAPVVALTGFAVVASDLHVLAGRDEVLVWVVDRLAGTARAGEPVRLRLEPVFDPATEAGARHDAASAAWRAGFAKGLGITSSIDAFVQEDQRADFAAGLQAGTGHRATLPPATVATISTGRDGLVRWNPGERYAGRGYVVTADLPHSPVPVESSARFGHAAQWTARTLAWADRPLVRPGETLRWRAVLRSFDGDRFRLPVGTVAAAVRLDNEVLWQGTLPVGDDGSLNGSATVPPTVVGGTIVLCLDKGTDHRLATVERLRLPEVSLEVDGVRPGEMVRAGQEAPLSIVLRDQAGSPLEGVECRVDLAALDQGESVPVQAVPAVKTDGGGRAAWSIPTLTERALTYRANLSFTLDGRAYQSISAWRTTDFPFTLEAIVRERTLTDGEVLRLELRLPKSATVEVGLGQGSMPPVLRRTVTGADQAWVEVLIPLEAKTVGCDVIEISAPTLDGRRAVRRIGVTIKPKPTTAAALVTLEPLRRRLDPGQAATLVLASALTTHDALVVVGARSLLDAAVVRLDQPAQNVERTVDPTWAPTAEVQAIVYERDRGFVTSARTPLEIRPIDRLLRLTLTPDRADPRPGDAVRCAVTVQDWLNRPVANAHLSLGVINELLYQLSEDDTPDLRSYFHAYHRPWLLTAGTGVELACPTGLLWRSVIRRWQGDAGIFGIRSGGGRKRSIGLCGGSCGSERAIDRIFVLPESETAICWVGDLTTDAQGRAEVAFTLPAVAGRFRLTARANDRAARLMVGEIRQTLVAARPVECRLDLPAVVSAGDDVAIAAVLRNVSDTSRQVELALAGLSERVDLPARSRRRVVLHHRAGAGTGPVREAGGLLGRIEEIAVAVTIDAARPDTVRDRLFIAHPGLPERYRGVLQADAAGVVRLPASILAGTAVHVTVQPFGDGPGRVAAWGLAHRQDGNAAVRAAAWLLAPAGQARREALAAAWKLLRNSADDGLVRQLAAHRNEATAQGDLGDDLLCGYVKSRGRALNLALGQPDLRGRRGSTFFDGAVIAAVARLETWGEGLDLWTRALADLDAALNTLAPERDTMRALAVMTDAAVILKDPAAARLATALARQDWSDPLVGILASAVFTDVDPESVGSKPGSATEVAVHHGDTITPLSGAFATWSGIAGKDWSVRARPGAIVGIDLIVQTAPVDAGVPGNATWWQQGTEGYQRCQERDGRTTLRPHRPTLLTLGNDRDHAATIRLLAPQGLTLAAITRERGDNLLIERWVRHHAWDDLTGIPAADLGARLAAWPARLVPVGQRIGTFGPASAATAGITLRRDGALVLITLPTRTSAGLALTSNETTQQAGFLLDWTWDDGKKFTCTRSLAVADDPLPLTPAAQPGHSEAARLIRLLPTMTKAEQDFLKRRIEQDSSLASWTRALDVLDPDRPHGLVHLIQHPAVSTAGHWSGRELRKILDRPLTAWSADEVTALIRDVAAASEHGNLPGDPRTWDPLPKIHEMFAAEHALELADLMQFAQFWRRLRQAAWIHLPQPQPSVPAAPPTVRACLAWFARVRPARSGQPTLDGDWLWTQALGDAAASGLGYDLSLDGWAAFVRSELEEDLVLDPAIPNRLRRLIDREAIDSLADGALGLPTLGDAGLGLFREGKRLMVRPIVPIVVATWHDQFEAVWKDKPLDEVIAELDRFTRNRDLGTVTADRDATRDVKFSLQDGPMRVIQILERISQACNLRCERTPTGWVFRAAK